MKYAIENGIDIGTINKIAIDDTNAKNPPCLINRMRSETIAWLSSLIKINAIPNHHKNQMVAKNLIAAMSEIICFRSILLYIVQSMLSWLVQDF